ncbi:unnamed protein product [Cochlearia groenlandica]
MNEDNEAANATRRPRKKKSRRKNKQKIRAEEDEDRDSISGDDREVFEDDDYDEVRYPDEKPDAIITYNDAEGHLSEREEPIVLEKE